ERTLDPYFHCTTMENTSSPLETLSKYSGNDRSCLETLNEESPFVCGCPTRVGHLIKSKPNMNCRRKREFISNEKKDASYWEKRRKNNEAAKRSREKRRLNDMFLENRVIALNDENVRLKTELLQLKMHFGLISAASFAKKSQQLGERNSAINSKLASLSSAQCYFSDYSSSPLMAINSDSSEAEQSGQGKCHRQLLIYSPRDSLSDMSNGSSRDSPEPICFEIKEEADRLEMNQLHSQKLRALYHGQQQPQDFHQELVTSNSSLQPASYSQRSVILYGSSKASHTGDNLIQPRKMQDFQKHKLSEAGPGEKYSLCHRFQQQLYKREINSSSQGEAVGQSHQYLPLLVTQSYLSAQDEKTPLWFYQGRQSNDSSSYMQSSSSDNVDPHRSNKDASTDEDESPTSSCYSENCSCTHQPASTLPSSQLTFQTQDEVKGTALPHKLRLKHRATSTRSGGSCSGQELLTSPLSATPLLPQQLYLA
uniref:BZIP domain-containing protein n=2 Tax=Tetraodon nigroviridis TaxID=99883 RepID=H3CSC9_TETNG